MFKSQMTVLNKLMSQYPDNWAVSGHCFKLTNSDIF